MNIRFVNKKKIVSRELFREQQKNSFREQAHQTQERRTTVFYIFMFTLFLPFFIFLNVFYNHKENINVK